MWLIVCISLILGFWSSPVLNAAPTGVLFVSPTNNLASSGFLAGPFSPSSQQYALSNSGTASLTWRASKNQPWLNLSATNGTLAVHVATTVTVSINSNANSLAAGQYADAVTFTNLTNGKGSTNRAVSLTINPIPAPSVLIATGVSATQINLSWADNSGNEIGFLIERAPDTLGTPGTWAQITSVSSNVTAYSDTGLPAIGTYWYRVRAYNTGGDSAYSNQASTTVPPPPSPPSNLTAAAFSYHQINLSWIDNSSDEDGFKIERSLDNTNFTQIAQVLPNTTVYRDTGVWPGTRYYYRVRAYSANGASAFSNMPGVTAPSLCPTSVVGWGLNDQGQATPPPGLAGVAAVAAGGWHSLVLKTNGTVFAWGYNYFGQATPPTGLTGVVALAAGQYHSLALRYDGTIVGWGETNLTALPPGLGGVVAISAGEIHNIALKSDGTVIDWGNDSLTNQPAGLNGVVAVTAGSYHALALKSDGTVVGWPSGIAADPPAGLTGVVAIAAGQYHSLALKSDGTVVAWGWERYGETIVPAGLSNVVAIAAGGATSLALKSDGTVVGWGYNGYGTPTPPTGLKAVGTIACGGHALALTCAPNGPLALTATSFAIDQIRLSWTNNAGNQDGFKIERAPDSSGSPGTWSQITLVGASITSLTDTGLVPNTKYWYRVRAYNAVADSDYGNQAVATTAALAPTLSVNPLGGLISRGPVGGPFNPTSQVYTITDTGNATLTWSATNTRPWVTLSATTGTLTPGGSAFVTVSINPAANGLTTGNHFDTVTFANLYNGIGNTNRGVGLAVGPTPDHFSFSTISNPQTSGVPFSVTITARDATNGIFTAFTNVVTFSMTSSVQPASLSPVTSGAFTAGQWTGLLTVNSLTLAHVTITANDGVGHTVSSNPIDVFRPPANVLIPAPTPTDMVEDATRGILYISAGSQVLRYDLVGGTYLPSFTFSGSNLKGLDISPDNNTLVVADGNYTSNLWIWVIDLPSGTSQKAEFPLAQYESGSWSVAFGNDGAVLFTSGFQGSGFTPLRRYDPVTKQVKVVFDGLDQYSMLRSSGDRKTIGIAESNDSCGPGLKYDVATQTIPSGRCSGWYTDEIGVNRDGSQFAVPTSQGTAIFDGNFNPIVTLGGPVGVGYHPQADLAFFSWNGTTFLRAYETHTLAEVARYDCGYTFSGPGGATYQGGRVRTSADGNDVFVSVGGGVRWISRGTAPPADLVVSMLDSPDPVGVASNLTYTITVSNNGPNGVPDAQLFDLLPPGVTFVSATTSQGSYSLSNGLVSCALGALAGGASATVNVVIVQSAEAILTNVAALTSSAADPNPNNNTVQAITAVQGIAAMSVTPGTSLVSAGKVGGPFSPSSQTYTLTNNGSSLLNWSASSGQNWLSLSPTNGTLAIGQSSTVSISINSNAAAFALGSYHGTVTFANLTNGIGNTSRGVDLTVYGVPYLSVTPTNGLTSRGPIGGPFSLPSQLYTLTNTGNVALAWSATNASQWVSLSATSGMLSPGAGVGVTASINASANGLTSGYYFDSVAFANLSNGFGNTSRFMRLSVGPAPDHFTLSAIANPQTSAVPFTVMITARDATNGIFTSFTNAVTVSATSSVGGVSLSPTNTGAFTAGQWTGFITVNTFTLANLTITVDDGFGHTGQSNAFYVVRPASNTFIPATNRVDMVSDSARGLLYITAGNQVLRYDLNAGAFLSPFIFGSNLIGIDISPDNNTLVVADNVIGTNALWVYVVDLPSGNIRKSEYPPGAGAGSWCVAFGNDNAALVSSVGQYFAAGPLLRFDPATNQYTLVGGGTADMLTSSGDGRTIGRAETHMDPGSFDRYDVATQTVTVHSGMTEPFDIGVNRDGTQFATPAYFGMPIFDATLTRVAVLGAYFSEGPLGVGYHPQADLVYLPWIPTTYLRVYETHTLAEVTRYDCGYSFGWAPNNSSFSAGRVRVSRDGNNVFVTIGNGVRWISQGVGLPADLALTQSVSPAPVGTGSYLTYTITATNGGPSAVVNAQVLDRLPSDATFVSANVSQGTWSQSNGVVTAGLGAINAGGNATINVVVLPPQPTVLTNIAAIVSSGADPNPSNNVATAVTSVDAAGSLIVTPTTGLVSAGLIGGPFSPVNQTYTLTNSGVLALNWSATNMAPWVSLSATGGTLAPGASTTVDATINSSANGLAVGTYADTITFTNLTYGYGTTQRGVTLTITLPANLAVTPSSGLNSTGPQTGPFAPLSQNYTVSNTGTATLNWTASNSNNWLTLSATSGSLSGGGSTTVTVSINSNANNLWAGSYTDSVVFNNLVNGLGNTTRGVSLTVTPAAILTVTPAAGLASSGFIGGPFSPASQVYSLTNSGSAGLSWSANNSQSWLSLSATSGTLGVGEGTTVTVSINSNASALGIGSYSDTVAITNLTNGSGSVIRSASLTILLPLNHFSFSAVASPQTAAVPITVTITARDATNGIFTGFAGFVSLTATSTLGAVLISPANSGTFSAGQWTGSVTITNPLTNVRLVATDGSGHIGLSNPFTVQVGPLDHFAWSTVPSPQSQSIPFSVAVTAQDAGNNTVTSFTGPVGLTASADGVTSVVEDFESGVWPHAPWVLLGNAGTLSAAFAHDGNFGLRDPDWAYRTDVRLGDVGNELSWWIRPSGTAGRAYLGFAASSTGAWSFVAAPNSGQIMIDQNLGYQFTNVVITNQTWQLNKWYKAVVRFTSPISVQCSLYDTDGVTLLNSLSYTNKSSLAGGVAMRSFGSWSLDMIKSGSGAALAMTPTNSGSFAAGVWTGAVTVLQAATNVVLVASDGIGHSGKSVQFVVQGVGILSAMPGAGLSSTGSVGGPFLPASQVYAVTNTGMGSLSWAVTNAAGWLSLSSAGGVLSPGTSTNITVSVNGTASDLVPGSYTDTVTFTNLANGIGTTNRSVSLVVSSLAWEQWRMQYFGCTNCPQAAAMADADGDGQNNWVEFLAGTDPTDSRSALRIVAINSSGSDTRVFFTSVGGKYYSLERCDFIGGPWTDIVTDIPGNAAVQWVKDSGGAAVPSVFYRIKLGQSTNAPAADSDGDGIPDLWSQQYFGHPTSQTNDHSCAICDADGTGQNNLNKYLAGLNPTNPASVFRIVSLVPQGNDLSIVWRAGGGRTNAVQASDTFGSGGNFSDIGLALILPGSGDMITNYLDVGGATNSPSRFYRVRLVP